jgi:hypothetical protein
MSILMISFVMLYFSASTVHGFVTEHSLLKAAKKNVGAEWGAVEA